MPSGTVSRSKIIGKSATKQDSILRNSAQIPLLNYTAAPLPDDDFVEDFVAEVERAKELSAKERERKRIIDENKVRREKGLNALPVPRDPKRSRKGRSSRGRHGSDEEEQTSYLAGSGDSDSWVTKSGDRKSKGQTKLDEERFTYEGQVIFPFNPLYQLSGLPEPADGSNAREELRQDLLARARRRHEPSSPIGTANTDQSLDMTIHNGAIKRKTDVSSDINVKVEHVENPTSGLAGVEDIKGEEEAPEEVYENEDLPLVSSSDTSTPFKDLGEMEAEEEAYEDELPEDTGLSTSNIETEFSSARLETVPDNLPPYRPFFAYTPEQALIGPLSLNGQAGDLMVNQHINRFLREYQRKGAQFFYDKYNQGKGGILGDDMGLGKTIQVIAFLSAIMRKTGTAVDDYNRRKKLNRSRDSFISPKHWPTALIVCPNSLVRNWARELNTWGYFEFDILKPSEIHNQRNTFLNGWLDLLIVPYETARSIIEEIKDLPFSVVIADEAHRLKTPSAALTLAMKKIVCASCFGLTGTLIQNRIEEIWSVLDFVDRGWAGTISQWKAFANPIKKGQQFESSAFDMVESIKRLGAMQARLLPYFCLRRDKRLIANELPAKNDLVMFCPLGRRQVIAYQNLIESEDVQFIVRRNELCDCGSGKPRIACHYTQTREGLALKEVILMNMTALTKVANHFGLLYHAKDDTDATRKVNEKIFKLCTGVDYNSKTHGVVEAALDTNNCGKWIVLSKLLEEWRKDRSANNKILIFSNSVRLLKMIAEFIATSPALSGFDFDSLTGEVNSDERMQMVDRFQDPESDHFVLLISTLAGGVGLNLTAANKVVIFDPNWNPANDAQAMDRAFRIGQKRVVDVYRLIGLGTLEELMYERQINKLQRAKQLNDGTMQARIHQGYDGAKTEEEQGDLYGVQNIFKFNPNGFAKANIQREMEARDRFIQDRIEAEYDSDSDDDPDNEIENEAGRKMKEERKQYEIRKAMEDSRTDKEVQRQKALIDDLLGEKHGSKSKKNDGDIFAMLKITPHMHEEALKESAEEREIYEIGLRLVRDFPDLARSLKANEIGKYKNKRSGTENDVKVEPGTMETLKRNRLAADPESEPWKARLEKKARTSTTNNRGPKMLASLSDDEEEDEGEVDE